MDVVATAIAKARAAGMSYSGPAKLSKEVHEVPVQAPPPQLEGHDAHALPKYATHPKLHVGTLPVGGVPNGQIITGPLGTYGLHHTSGASFGARHTYPGMNPYAPGHNYTNAGNPYAQGDYDCGAVEVHRLEDGKSVGRESVKPNSTRFGNRFSTGDAFRRAVTLAHEGKYRKETPEERAEIDAMVARDKAQKSPLPKYPG